MQQIFDGLPLGLMVDWTAICAGLQLKTLRQSRTGLFIQIYQWSNNRNLPVFVGYAGRKNLILPAM